MSEGEIINVFYLGCIWGRAEKGASRVKGVGGIRHGVSRASDLGYVWGCPKKGVCSVMCVGVFRHGASGESDRG